VLVLRDVEGLTAPEVAEVLGIGVQAVKSRLHRARLVVRARVAPLLGIVEQPAAAEGTCPDVLMLLSRHLEGEIGTEVCAEMERHLQGCGRCKGACESLKRTLALCNATPAAEGAGVGTRGDAPRAGAGALSRATRPPRVEHPHSRNGSPKRTSSTSASSVSVRRNATSAAFWASLRFSCCGCPPGTRRRGSRLGWACTPLS
jgi:hypothetical protein